VGSRPLIEYPLRALVQAGVRELAIVIGYLGGEIQRRLGDGQALGARITYIWNHRYQGGNASSLACARSWVGQQPFLLLMGDHLVSPALIRCLTRAAADQVAVDRLPAEHLALADAVKVLVGEDGQVLAIGKGLAHWNGVDAGAFLCTAAIFNALGEGNGVAELSQAMATLATARRLWACDISGHPWLDVDTPQDLLMANRLVESCGFLL